MEDNSQEVYALQPWDPISALKSVSAREAALSRGFLRSRPEKWFPGFAADWHPLAHSIGVELRILEVKPQQTVPGGLEFGFAGLADNETLGLFISGESSRALVDSVLPGAGDAATKLVLEYLARRLLTSLAVSWSGPESSVISFNREGDPWGAECGGAISVKAALNGSPFELWIKLGPRMVNRMDGLWRRQVHSSQQHQPGENLIELEVAQLAVPPSMLGEYMKSGTVVDLEIPISDRALLRMDGKPWLPARLVTADQSLAAEVLSGPASSSTPPEGTTRLSIRLASMRLPSIELTEFSQAGAILETGLDASNTVEMVIEGEVVGSATLCSYEGRFAISVG